MSRKLPIKFPTQDSYPFLATLENKYQEVIWSVEYSTLTVLIDNDFDGHLQVVKKKHQELITMRDSEDVSILEHLTFANDLEYVESKWLNEDTGEEIVQKEIKPTPLAMERALKVIEGASSLSGKGEHCFV